MRIMRAIYEHGRESITQEHVTEYEPAVAVWSDIATVM